MDYSSLSLSSLFAFQSLDEALSRLLVVTYIGISLAGLFYIMWGGLRYIMSAGDADKTAGARRTIVNAVIGLLLLAIVGVFWESLIRLFLPTLAPYYGID